MNEISHTSENLWKILFIHLIHVIKFLQKEVLTETTKMIPEVRKRLQDAVEGLEMELVIVSFPFSSSFLWIQTEFADI